MAINANELRIGNWITLRGDYFQVDGGDIYDLSRGKEVEDRVANPEDWKPILISSELLEKCGFANVYFGGIESWAIKISKKNSIEWHDDNSVLIGDYFGDGSTPFAIEGIQHLHQLQNLYFSLTGKELTINL